MNIVLIPYDPGKKVRVNKNNFGLVREYPLGIYLYKNVNCGSYYAKSKMCGGGILPTLFHELYIDKHIEDFSDYTIWGSEYDRVGKQFFMREINFKIVLI